MKPAPVGSANSSKPARSRPASLTPETSGTFSPPTSKASRNATSSPASAFGVWHFVPPAGPTTDLFGQVPAPANLSARQAKALGLLTSGTYGPPSTGSSASDVLQSSLESRLRQRLQTLGSTLYRLTWKPWALPSGRLLSRLRASAPRTSGTGTTGWPSPQARDFKGAPVEGNELTHNARPLNEVVRLSGWPTPLVNDSESAGGAGSFERGGRGVSMAIASKLAGWTTPTSHQQETQFQQGGSCTAFQATLAGWPTTTTEDSQDSRAYGYGGQTQMTLTDAARCADSGPALTGSPVGMTSGGQLNPAHSRWLMGLPPVWDACGVTAMPSARRPRKRSSKA